MFESWEERAWKSDMDQALRLAAGVALPARSRSLTRAEAMGNDGGRAVMIYLLTMIVPFLFLAAVFKVEEPASKAAWVLVGALVTYGMFAMGRSIQQRRAAYVDPEIVVEIAKDGVTVRNPAGAHALADHALRYEFVHYSHDGSVTFLGIKLDTPLGLIELHDHWYQGARAVAAAIVARAEREKIEGGLLRI